MSDAGRSYHLNDVLLPEVEAGESHEIGRHDLLTWREKGFLGGPGAGGFHIIPFAISALRDNRDPKGAIRMPRWDALTDAEISGSRVMHSAMLTRDTMNFMAQFIDRGEEDLAGLCYVLHKHHQAALEQQFASMEGGLEPIETLGKHVWESLVPARCAMMRVRRITELIDEKQAW